VTGFSRWLQKKLLPFIDITEIRFIPQGLAMFFYGSLAVRSSLYVFVGRSWSLGSGFNEYNKEEGKLHIFRLRFPGQNRRREFFYSFLEFKTLYLDRRSYLAGQVTIRLNLFLNKRRKICLTRLNAEEISSDQEIESFTSSLAKFLKIPLEGLGLFRPEFLY
jgi:hypothetical protein